jgi:L-alanine-DL-glutamate epimerase-like enolase superfamily enzyme
MVLFYKDYLLGEDPTDVERVMLKIRRLGAFKPWGAAVSAIEIALWDIAGQAAGVPVYKLLGGKIRDRVRIYNGGFRPPMTGQTPQDYAENVQKMKEAKEGFTLIKMAVGFHNPRDDGCDPQHVVRRPAPGSVAPEPRSDDRTRPEVRDLAA